MAVHPRLPRSPCALLDPAHRGFLADEALRASSCERCCRRWWRWSTWIFGNDAMTSLPVNVG